MSDVGRTVACQLEFIDAFARVFGGSGVADAATTIDWIDSPVGPLLVGASPHALQLLTFTRAGDVEQQLQRVRACHAIAARGTNAVTANLRAQLGEYFAAQRREFDIPVQYAGSDFQQRVWGTLRSIPYGQTWSYLDVARCLEDPGATRAVGMANGANPIAIVIPCHRVINANGALGGFGGGSWRKQMLLDLENGQGRLL